MMRTGSANLPLHGGKAPKWLFGRMVKLAKAVSTVFIEERGCDQYLRHLADPFWFQALSCVLGFDWHSSGTTTVTCHALKQALNDGNLGLKVLGGKGTHSRNVPTEIMRTSTDFNIPSSTERELVRSSRLTAKIDNTAIQDGYGLYHHSFIITEGREWAVVQQGMNTENRYARRYHWLSEDIDRFLDEPNRSILSDMGGKSAVLDLSASGSGDNRRTQLDLVRDNIGSLSRDARTLMGLDARQRLPANQKGLGSFIPGFPSRDHIGIPSHIPRLDMPRKLDWATIRGAYEIQPGTYEELLLVPGMGPKTVRALSLISELIYGDEASWKDPVRFSFALGGKDGVPYPVDREEYDNVIEIYGKAIDENGSGSRRGIEKLEDLRRCAPPYSF